MPTSPMPVHRPAHPRRDHHRAASPRPRIARRLGTLTAAAVTAVTTCVAAALAEPPGAIPTLTPIDLHADDWAGIDSAMAFDGRVYLGRAGEAGLWSVDPATGTFRQETTVPPAPGALVVHAIGASHAVISTAGGVARLDLDANTVTAAVAVSGFRVPRALDPHADEIALVSLASMSGTRRWLAEADFDAETLELVTVDGGIRLDDAYPVAALPEAIYLIVRREDEPFGTLRLLRIDRATRVPTLVPDLAMTVGTPSGPDQRAAAVVHDDALFVLGSLPGVGQELIRIDRATGDASVPVELEPGGFDIGPMDVVDLGDVLAVGTSSPPWIRLVDIDAETVSFLLGPSPNHDCTAIVPIGDQVYVVGRIGFSRAIWQVFPEEPLQGARHVIDLAGSSQSRPLASDGTFGYTIRADPGDFVRITPSASDPRPPLVTIPMAGVGFVYDGPFVVADGVFYAGANSGADTNIPLLVRTGDDCDDDGIADRIELFSADGSACDCDGTQIPDACEIADGTSLDLDGDGRPDACGCAGDMNGDGAVGVADLVLVLFDWDAPRDPCASDDPVRDGVIGIDDLLLVLGRWGPCPTR